jgi:hypothetical protein
MPHDMIRPVTHEPRRLVGITCAVIVIMSGAVSEVRTGPASAPTPAVQVRVNTITAFTVSLIGQRVRVVDGVVSTIASPRFFILSGTGLNTPLSRSGTVAVILESGSAMLSPGQQVVVTGEVRGALAPGEEVGRGIGTLTMEERGALQHRPLLIVNSASSLSR